MKRALPDRVVNRLTLYHCILTECLAKQIQFISSPKIASLLKIDDSQVRRDLNFIELAGKNNVGYLVAELKQAIEEALSFGTAKDAFIIGAGNLGFALAKYDNFSNYGLNTLALFDNDILKVGTTINNKKVFHISKLADLARRLQVNIAILTVSKEQAQAAANVVVEAKIKYIWNFTPAILEVPDELQVWNENLAGSFLRFTYSSQMRHT